MTISTLLSMVFAFIGGSEWSQDREKSIKLFIIAALLFACNFLEMRYARAETVQLPITATIIQCGTKYEALGQCKAGVEACCAFAPIEEQLNEIETAAGDEVSGATSLQPPQGKGDE